jgi:hypothetical protein
MLCSISAHVKRRFIRIMKEDNQEIHSQKERDSVSPSAPASANRPETETRREMIATFGKVAIVAAPLLMFVSKARAIHSRP